MALPTDLREQRCIEWCAELPYLRRPRESPAFKLKDSECILRLNYRHGSYYLYLIKKDALFPEYRVKIYFGLRKENSLVRARYSPALSEIPVQQIWGLAVHEAHVFSDLPPDPRFGNYIRFMLIFENLDGSSEFSAREEKATQVDLCVQDIGSLSVDFSALFEKSAFPDVQIRCNGGVVHAHKAILAARSIVFYSMFKSNMKETNSGIIKIPNVDILTMQLFLKFLYCGKINELPLEIAADVYMLADKYEVHSLKKVCSDVMVEHTSEENYIDFLHLADTHSDDYFKNTLSEYITNHVELMKRESWLYFSAENPKVANEVLQKYISKSLWK